MRISKLDFSHLLLTDIIHCSMSLKTEGKGTSLLYNIRMYILAYSLALAVFVASLLRLSIPDNRLYVIRLEQVYGLMSIVYWYAALCISPVTKLLGKRPFCEILNFSRRAIGVSAASFAIAHFAIAFWGQLEGFDGISLLNSRFRWSLGLGLLALVVLFMMAATSLNVIVDWMTYRRWKWLHRLTYVAGVAVILHIWIIGTHVGEQLVQIIAFDMLAVLFGLELTRVYRLLKGKKINKLRAVIIVTSIWFMLVGGLILMRFKVSSVSLEHAGHAGEQGYINAHEH